MGSGSVQCAESVDILPIDSALINNRMPRRGREKEREREIGREGAADSKRFSISNNLVALSRSSLSNSLAKKFFRYSKVKSICRILLIEFQVRVLFIHKINIELSINILYILV